MGRLDVEVGLAADRRRQRLRPAAQPGRIAFDLVSGAAVVPGEEDDRAADHLLRVAGIRRGTIEAEDAGHVVRRGQGVLSEGGPELPDLARREAQDAAVEIRPERLEPELERGRDPEVPAGATQAPEELGLLGLARVNEATIGGDEVDGDQIVDRQPEVPLQPADSAPERQSCDAGVAHDPDRADQPMRLRGDIELAEEGTAVRACDPPRGVDLDTTHRGHVDEEPTVGTREARGAVAAGPDRDLEVMLAGESDGRGDLRRGRRADDGRGPSIVNRVPQPPRIVVRRVVGGDDLAAGSTQLIQMARCDRCRGFDHSFPPQANVGRRSPEANRIAARLTRGSIQCSQNWKRYVVTSRPSGPTTNSPGSSHGLSTTGRARARRSAAIPTPISGWHVR